jgi:hypothetical protein
MDENLIAINVPNGISILIMAAVGGLVLAFVRKLAMAQKGGAVASGPVFSN